jgi:hypothetical protein
MNMRRTITLIALATAVGLSGYALAGGGEQKPVAKEKWLAQSEIKSKLGALGYSVWWIEIEDGRYEVKAIDRQGAQVELYVNPVTGEVEKPKEGTKEQS